MGFPSFYFVATFSLLTRKYIEMRFSLTGFYLFYNLRYTCAAADVQGNQQLLKCTISPSPFSIPFSIFHPSLAIRACRYPGPLFVFKLRQSFAMKFKEPTSVVNKGQVLRSLGPNIFRHYATSQRNEVGEGKQSTLLVYLSHTLCLVSYLTFQNLTRLPR